MDATRQEIRRGLRGARLQVPAIPAPARAPVPLPRPPRAILFDVYGTLLLDAARPARGQFSAAARLRSLLRRHRVGLSQEELAARIAEAVAGEQAALRDLGIAHPEVRIELLWSSLLPGRDDDEVRAIAAGWEAAVRPVLPAPGCRALLAHLRGAGLAVGIVSNAQFYTPLFLEALLGAALEELGFDGTLCAWSHDLLAAKPGPELFGLAAARLAARGIEPPAALLVGNDPRNDIAPAAARGFMTVLVGDPRETTPADAVIGRLSDLAGLVSVGG